MTEEQLKESLENEKLKNKELTTKLSELESNLEKASKQLEGFEEHKTKLNNENKGHRLENKELLEKLEEYEKKVADYEKSVETYKDYEDIKEKAKQFDTIQQERLDKEKADKLQLLEKFPEDRRPIFEKLEVSEIENLLKDFPIIQEGNSISKNPLTTTPDTSFAGAWNQLIKG